MSDERQTMANDVEEMFRQVRQATTNVAGISEQVIRFYCDHSWWCDSLRGGECNCTPNVSATTPGIEQN